MTIRTVMTNDTLIKYSYICPECMCHFKIGEIVIETENETYHKWCHEEKINR
jgi:hypothetical protein